MAVGCARIFRAERRGRRLSRTATSETTSATKHYGRWRAATLAGVYLLMGLHIAHWRIAGKTLAPLELNEVMYTLELGIVTAGFLFMLTAVIATAIFGRFFCSWGCHILALEDLCVWLLERANIRPSPVRSRLLLLVPPLAMLYMFVWPQALRLYAGRPLPKLTVLSDTEGWASFSTSDFWRNLPGPGITLLTFAICGFAIVYVLGSRSFCRYACPYGALFSLADRVAPGKILVKGDCTKCGRCTAVCQSQVRVHHELAAFGRVVDPACMKDLDCVAACPTGAVRFGFARPAGFLSWKHKVSRPRVYDLSWGEELWSAAGVIAALLIFRGLYGTVPFLLALGLGPILGFTLVVGVRLWRRRELRVFRFRLKRNGRLTRTGGVAVAVVAAVVAFTAHSAMIRCHEVLGERAFGAVIAAGPSGPRAVMAQAQIYLERLDRWGLWRPIETTRRLATLGLLLRAPARAEPHLVRLRQLDPGVAEEIIAGVRAGQGDLPAAIAAYRASIAVDPVRIQPRLALGELLANTGDLVTAAREFEAAIEIAPNSARAHYNLSVVLKAQRRNELARAHLQQAASLDTTYAALVDDTGNSGL